MSACTCASTLPPSGKLQPWLERAGGALAAAVLILTPKCPACVAAWVMLWTGLGLSITVAATLRATLLILAVAALLYAALGHGRRLARLIRTYLRNAS